MNTCVDCKKEYQFSPEELEKYKAVDIPPSVRCFDCRMMHYFSFWLFGKFRKGMSDLSGKSMITMLPENARYPIYLRDEWWSDVWDPMDYGQNYDSNRTLFEQLKELQEKVPRPHRAGELSVNCDWSDDAWSSKDCYLTRSVLRCENVSYGYRAVDTKDSYDVTYVYTLQDSYDCLYCFDSHNLNFSENCRNCMDSYFLYDCRGCTNCFMCWNLRNKQYCIENKQYSKEEYFEKVKKYRLSSHKQLQELYDVFNKHLEENAVHRQVFDFNCIESKGNFITNCKNCSNVFGYEDSENCLNMMRGLSATDCIDAIGSWNTELSGNLSCVTEGYQVKYSNWSEARYSEYIDNCYDCENCFACVGLRKKKYCILNKQYTEKEYIRLRDEIISTMKKEGTYGQFLPWGMSLGPFNLSTGIIYFPNSTQQDIKSREGYWQESSLAQDDGVLSESALIDDVADTNDDICSQALICPESHYRFNISANELSFHKRKKFALPRKHFDIRTLKRLSKTSGFKEEKAHCYYCREEIIHYYKPEFGYKKIACTECYKKEIS